VSRDEVYLRHVLEAIETIEGYVRVTQKDLGPLRTAAEALLEAEEPGQPPPAR